jgi:hypothetical protein
MQVLFYFVHDVNFCILLCGSVGLEFLFSLVVSDHFGLDMGVSFKVFSCLVCVVTTIVESVNIGTCDKMKKGLGFRV